MDLTKAEKDYLIKEISLELGAKFDGSHKNLIPIVEKKINTEFM